MKIVSEFANLSFALDDRDSEAMRRPTDQLVDELLVMRCQSGEAGAMDSLVRRWQRPLWRYAHRLTGRPEAAWEVAQEAWMGIVRGIRKLDDPASFRKWAYRIVTNKAADWIRRRRRLRDRTEALDEQVPAAPRAADGDDRLDRVREAIRRLPPGLRAIVSLHYVDDFTVAEIAEILRIPAGTVKSRLHHARNELRRLCEGELS